MSKKNLFGIMLMLVSLMHLSCKKEKAFIVKPPEQVYLNEEQRHKEVSIINVPFELSLDEIELKINKDLGTLLYEDNSMDDNGGDNLMMRVTKRKPLQITPNANGYNVKVPVNIWAKAGWKVEKFGIALAKYEETQFDLDVNFQTVIGISENWQVSSKTSPAGYKWVSKPVLRIGMFEVPITGIIERLIDQNLGIVAQIVDKEVSKITYKPEAELAWKYLYEPILINEAFQVWLKLTPRELLMVNPRAVGRNVRVMMGVKAITETFVGKKPPIINPAPLPPLKLVDDIPDRFEVALINEVPFAEARRLALQQVKDQVFMFNDGKQKIKVLDLDIWGHNENLVVAATLSGSINGKVYLKGEPFYDASDMTLKLKNLDYDLETKNKLIKTADWLAHGQFTRRMEPLFKMPLKAQIEQAKSLISANLAGNQIHENIKVNGNLDKLIPDKIIVAPGSIQAIIKAEGKLEVIVKGIQ
jgi:hypothetical protein